MVKGMIFDFNDWESWNSDGMYTTTHLMLSWVFYHFTKAKFLKQTSESSESSS